MQVIVQKINTVAFGLNEQELTVRRKVSQLNPFSLDKKILI